MLCPDPFFVVDLVLAQERKCFDSLACESSGIKIREEKRFISRTRACSPFTYVLTRCVPEGLVLLEVTHDTARTSIKDECDPLGTRADAMHPQKLLVILCLVLAISRVAEN